jgi:hypothetical protein
LQLHLMFVHVRQENNYLHEKPDRDADYRIL